ncbi:MAG: hypothetical protein VX835_02760 [Pseudomonadota bacterium]|nr:hypothetical protein [Pseudomonadota bacterium]
MLEEQRKVLDTVIDELVNVRSSIVNYKSIEKSMNAAINNADLNVDIVKYIKEERQESIEKIIDDAKIAIIDFDSFVSGISMREDTVSFCDYMKKDVSELSRLKNLTNIEETDKKNINLNLLKAFVIVIGLRNSISILNMQLNDKIQLSKPDSSVDKDIKDNKDLLDKLLDKYDSLESKDIKQCSKENIASFQEYLQDLLVSENEMTASTSNDDTPSHDEDPLNDYGIDEIHDNVEKDSDDVKYSPKNPLFGKSQESVDDKNSPIPSKKK